MLAKGEAEAPNEGAPNAAGTVGAPKADLAPGEDPKAGVPKAGAGDPNWAGAVEPKAVAGDELNVGFAKAPNPPVGAPCTPPDPNADGLDGVAKGFEVTGVEAGTVPNGLRAGAIVAPKAEVGVEVEVEAEEEAEDELLRANW